MPQNQKFSATVGKFASASEKRLDAVHKESAKRVIDIAQTPSCQGRTNARRYRVSSRERAGVA
jgi:uncharacterized protein YbbK (DUF523 family)